MDYVFVKTAHNYADEFDCCSAFCMLKLKFEEAMIRIQHAFESGLIDDRVEFYFGSNEYLSIENFEDFESGITVANVSKDFVNTFGDHVGFKIFQKVLDKANEAYDDEDYEEVELE